MKHYTERDNLIICTDKEIVMIIYAPFVENMPTMSYSAWGRMKQRLDMTQAEMRAIRHHYEDCRSVEIQQNS